MADEPPIGGGPRLPRGRNGNNSGTPVAKVTAQVKVDGLNIMDRLMSSIAKSTTTIAKNLKLINSEASGAMAGFLAGATGGRVGGGGGGGGGTNTMTWQGSVPALKPKGPTSQTGAPTTLPWTGKLPTITPTGPVSQVGSQEPPGGTPPGGGGGISGAFRNSMPWLGAQAMRAGSGATTAMLAAPRAMLAAAPLVDMLSGRIGQQITEGAPIAAQSLLTSSMYQGTRYSQIERGRYDQLGRFAGSRQDVAAAGQMSLRLGQTPQQSGQYLQGVGNMVQSMGGTMTAPQVIQATGGFLDSLVMRRQIASGMRPARIGGQVRDPREVSADYIKNFEQKFNGGRKLNEFDFINLQTPGSGLRIRFQRLYGLDDSAIDMLTIAGMQSLRAGSSLSTSAQLSAAGMSRDRISLAVASLQTTKGVRNANFLANTEGGMVNQLHTEETLQEAMGKLEEHTSGLISEFASLERVIKGVTTGLGVIAGLSILKGGVGGGGGGGGLLGGLGFGGFGRNAAGGPGTGAPVTAAAAEGEVAAGAAGAAGGATAAGGMSMGQTAGLGVMGVGFGISAAKTAVNATDWGSLFSAGAQGAMSGAAIGTAIFGPGWGTAGGAAAGGIIAIGAAGVNWLNQNNTDQRDAALSSQSQSASNMTDKEILDKYTQLKSQRLGSLAGRNGPSWQHFVDDNEDDTETRGILDRFQIRRSALIAQWMAATREDEPAFDNYMIWMAQRYTGKDEPSQTAIDNATTRWGELERHFNELSTQPTVDDNDYNAAGEELLHMTEAIRGRGAAKAFTGGDELHAQYLEFFRNDVDHPMQYKPVYSDAALNIIGQYQFTPGELAGRIATGAAPGEGPNGDPVFGDGNDHGGLTPTEPFNYGSISRLRMAPEPDDPNWNKMDKRMQQRLRIMFANSGGQVRWEKGGGWRSSDAQRRMFLDRYRPDPNGEITWNGQKWKHVKGPAAAPPGRSYHEIGLAADLGGPGVGNGWLRKNARRFGLKEFSSVNSEPWHVQLIELPNGRSSYDQDADTGGAGAEPTATDTAPADSGPAMGGGGGNLGIGGGTSGSLLSFGNSSLATLSAGAGSAASAGGDFGGTGGKTTADTTVDYSGSGPLTGEQIAKMAYNAGFRGDGLLTILGIAKRESNWDPGAHNTNANTGDNSYGLTQINMLGNLGPSRAKQFGISDYNELLNPQTNLKAAFTMSGGTEFGPWLGYRAGLTINREQREAALAAVHAAHLGDAVFDSGQSSSSSSLATRSAPPVSVFGSMVAGTGRGMNINVTINSNGNYAYDARQLARQVRPAFEAEYAEVSAKRNT